MGLQFNWNSKQATVRPEVARLHREAMQQCRQVAVRAGTQQFACWAACCTGHSKDPLLQAHPSPAQPAAPHLLHGPFR